MATKMAVERWPDTLIVYTDPGMESADNGRFIADCESWFGRQVIRLKSVNFTDALDVCQKYRFLSSENGAPCTAEMKKIPAGRFWMLGDLEVFGYTVEEKKRMRTWAVNNPERRIFCPLIEENISKEMCFSELRNAGIELPLLYKQGFRNNNCIGCVKARDNLDYWKRVRKFYPDNFSRVASLERTLGHAINRVRVNGVRTPVFLDELPAGDPKGADESIACGLFCGSDIGREEVEI